MGACLAKPVPPGAADPAVGMRAAIGSMDGSAGFDCVVVCTSTPAQEAYWQARLEATRGQACKPDAIVVAVHEDWAADGAGNGLGTLYAFTKARKQAAAKGHDLDDLLAKGGSIGMYHTAGKGTRLAPLPGAENNNKPGVKLPSIVDVNGTSEELTILEAVVRQTGVYAAKRPGRLSVFWGDQIFVPSAGHNPSGAHHADILSSQGPMPTAEEWAAKGLEKYGLIAVNGAGEATQVEKVNYETASELLSTFGTVKTVGPSLGSFSVSDAMLKELLAEFAKELEGKEAKFDSDPHFWMPLTFTSKSAYAQVMIKKGEFDEAAANAHYDRMQALRARLSAATPGTGIFGCVDVGDACYWWDYGMLKLYVKNNILATETSEAAAALRQFLKIPDGGVASSDVGSATIGGGSVVLASKVAEGKVEGSILSNVRAGDVDAEGCILVNVTAKRVKGKGCVVYNVVCDDKDGLVLEDGAVVTNVFMPPRKKLVMKSTTDTDGGKVFKTKLDYNPHSFNDVYGLNKQSDVSKCYEMGKKAHADAAKKLGVA